MQRIPSRGSKAAAAAVDAAASEAVVVEDLVKRYPKSSANAVDGVSFTVHAGEVLALLGPNGAGKTTTVGMLTTRVKPTSGRAAIGGIDVLRDPVAARAELAVVPQRSNLDRAISIQDNLVFHATYHGVSRPEAQRRAKELLDQFGLAERAKEKPDFFSGGQAQRVMIARALMHRPRVLFLDEPSTGLDPAARLFVWDRLKELRQRGVTLMLTTHDMNEAAELSDRVAIMDYGRVLSLDTPAALMRSLRGSTTLELSATARNGGGASERLLESLLALREVERVESLNDGGEEAQGGGVRLRLYVAGEAPSLLAPAAALLDEHGMQLSAVEIGTPTLEDVFIHLTGRKLR